MPAHGQHALVLGGGGARGLAHAGAIRALEELGYDADVVVGTSMGAIIGALYAAGYDGEQVRQFVAGENWLERFAAEPLLVGRDRAVLRPVLSFGLRDGPAEGLLPATGVNIRLVALLFDAGARARNDFDRLPRRFRAVAADFADGSEFVIGAGDLPRAVRASMAVPGIFAPVSWDGRILVDGGIANNLPVSVAAALTDLPIIAVDVLRPSAEVPERGPLDSGVRALRLLLENARPDDVAGPAVLVLPSIGPGFGESRFPADPERLLRAGYDAVREQVAPSADPRRRIRAAAAPPARITGLRVIAPDSATARLVRRVMAPAVGRYDPATVIARVTGLYGSGLFQSIWPRLEFADVAEGSGALPQPGIPDQATSADATLVVDVTTVARTNLAGAARWDTDRGAGAWLTLRERVTLRTPVELRTTGVIDQQLYHGSAEASVFSGLLPGIVWTGGAHAGVEQVRLVARDSVAGTVRLARRGAWAGAELHGPIRNWFVSLLLRADRVNGPGGDRVGSTGSGTSIGPHMRLTRPPQPDRVVGVEPLLEAETRAGGATYSRGRTRIGTAGSLGRVRLAVLADAQLARGTAPFDVLPSTTWEQAPWLPAGALHDTRHVTLGADVAHPFVLDGYLRVRLRALDTAERGRHVGGDAGAVWPTVIGPAAIAVAIGEGGVWRVNLGIGAPVRQ
jgi:predicted acylesterase/phospholipase RssA